MVFYNDWVINAYRFPDSTYFFHAMDTFEKQCSDQKEWNSHRNLLLGYYYYGKNWNKTINYYSSFLNTRNKDHRLTYRHFAESYFSLRKAYDTIADMSRADLIFLRLDSTRRYCLTTAGHFAESLFEEYLRKKNVEDLYLANAYFDFIEQHSFRSLLNADEDAFLTFQYETGSKIFARAIEAAYEAWKITKDKHWLDKALNYMEYLKSYLLYRDMLKHPNGNENEYSLSDTIRILQEQLSQVLFKTRINTPSNL